MTAVGVHGLDLRSGTSFLVCICQGCLVPDPMYLASMSQHMICLCKLATYNTDDKLVCVQAGSSGCSTQVGNYSNLCRMWVFTLLCPPLIVQTNESFYAYPAYCCRYTFSCFWRWLDRALNHSPFVQQRHSPKKLFYNRNPAYRCKHPSQRSHRQPGMLLEHKRKANTTPFGINLTRNQALTYLSISCCQLSWLWLQDLLQQGQDACLVQPQRHWHSIEGDSVPQMGVRWAETL